MELIFCFQNRESGYSGVFIIPENPFDILTEEAAEDAGSRWADDHPQDIVMIQERKR